MEITSEMKDHWMRVILVEYCFHINDKVTLILTTSNCKEYACKLTRLEAELLKRVVIADKNSVITLSGENTGSADIKEIKIMGNHIVSIAELKEKQDERSNKAE